MGQINSEAFRVFTAELKVSKSQKQNFVLKFQVFPDRQDRKTNLSVRFRKKFFSTILLMRFIDLYIYLSLKFQIAENSNSHLVDLIRYLIEMKIPSDINPPFKVVEVKAKSDGQKYALKILKDSAKSR